MASLATDLDDPKARPYFLWNVDMTVEELHHIIDDPNNLKRVHYVATLMREARVREVWKFISPRQIVELWPQVQIHLGRRRRFWRYLLDTWRQIGAV